MIHLMLSVGEGQIILFTYAWGRYRHLRRSSSTTGNLHIWGGNKFVSPSGLVGNVKEGDRWFVVVGAALQVYTISYGVS